MALSIKDETVQKALEAGLALMQQDRPLLDRMTEIQKTADKIGKVNPATDYKILSDEIWTP